MGDQLKEYEGLREKLNKTLLQKKQLEDEFDALQQEIYDKETEYFSNRTIATASGALKHVSTPGNIIKGFDGFTKSHSHHHHGGTASAASSSLNLNSLNTNSDFPIENSDRIFSLSSATFIKQLQQQQQSLRNFQQSQLQGEEDDGVYDDDDDAEDGKIRPNGRNLSRY
ncbi:hypothetical protein KAFR_0G01040 [Kazachstania africana CBS 2517]|uniref:Chromatin modification-related protein EAF6 n=1 Tax=Kazachstania africana (strain ATCC 22294 / BCRC 22015 / CBS 2517 / CECT 1963 / NBRC 1671 / NRRL Y-8276) TaxID=1071382 RepID=H2AXN7_KAZAF|nr:hypothetical protein KAFR_0G01040 [Kazachstania africana CBS 2517]CCF59137.1 hypothetical protein KAFR_0G01040 [Kazachstania africana CBS 2517]